MSPALLLALGLIRAPLPPTKVIVPPPSPIAGVVVDEQGRPVAEAEVIRTGILLADTATPTVLWRGKTDTDGRYSFERSNGVTEGLGPGTDIEYVIVALPGRRPAVHQLPSWSAPSSEAPLRIELRPPASVSIRVLGPDGAPVVGARVHLIVFGLGELLPTVLGESFVATTGADGRARLALVDSTADPARCLISAPQFGTQSVPYDSHNEEEKVLALRAASRLSGHVVADDGAMAWHVHIQGISSVRSPDRSSTFATGRLDVITGLDGRFEVPAIAAGRVSAFPMLPERYVAAGENAETTVEIGKPAEVKLTLKRGIAVRGVLRERGSGRPIAHASVRARQSASRLFSYRNSARTDDDGRFEFFLHPGPVRISLTYAGPYALVDGPTQQLGTIPEGVESCDLQPIELVRGVDMRVIVRDPVGKPVAGADVDVVLANGQRVPSASLSRDRLTNAQGELTLWPLPPDRKVELFASLDDAASGPPVPVLPDALKPATLVLSMKHTMSLSGRVVDEHGKPVVDAAVSITSRRRTSSGRDVIRSPLGLKFLETGNLRTDADGRFQSPRQLQRFEAVRVRVRAPGKLLAETDWFAPTTPSLFDITLNRVPPPEQAQVRTDYDAGWASYQRGDYINAETRFQTAITNAEKRGVRDPLDFASWLAGLAEARRCLGKNDSAEALARRILDLREQALHPTHPAVAEAHALLGSILQTEGKTAEAETHFRKALDIHQRTAGPVSPGYAHVLALLGSLELDQGRNKEAETDLARADSIIETIRGPESNERLWGLENRGIVLWKLRRLPEAEAVFRQTLGLLEKAFGAEHAETVRVRKELAQLVRASTKAGAERDQQ